MKLTVNQLRRIIKEEVQKAANASEYEPAEAHRAHTAMLKTEGKKEHTADCDYDVDQTFTCSSCGKEVCYCQGAAEDMVCTNCWAKSHEASVMPEGRSTKLTVAQLRKTIKEEVASYLDESIAGLASLQSAVTSVYSPMTDLPPSEVTRIAHELNRVSNMDITVPEAEALLSKKLPPVRGLNPQGAAHMLVSMLGMKQKCTVRTR